MEKQAYTINQFCYSFGISRAFLYQLWDADLGPRRYKIGSRVLISNEAAQEWQRQQEGS